MNYSNKLDIQEIFKQLEKEHYCIIKLSKDFPNYYEYSDIDIFCFDMKKLANIILTFGNEYVKKGWEIKVNTSAIEGVLFTDIDFYPPNATRLDLKLSLYQSFPQYKKVNIKEGLFYRIIEFRQEINFDNFKIYVPSKIDDLILRYIEYVEYYDIRADKIKHVEYILNKATDEERSAFLDKLHIYTHFPLVACDLTKVQDNINQQQRKEKEEASYWLKKNIRKKPLKFIEYIITGKYKRLTGKI